MPVNIGVNIQRSPNRINQQLREAGVEGKFPKLLLDFKDQYYLASGGSKTLANAVTHARSGNATMTDGYGPELVTNGGFDSDVSGWTNDRDAVLTVTDGKLNIANSTNTYSGIIQEITLKSGGGTYDVELDYTKINSNARIAVGTTSGGNDLADTSSIFSSGKQSVRFTTTTETVYVKIYVNSPTSGDSITIDNVSVREMPVLKWAPHNLLTYSEQFDNAVWAKIRTTVAANQITAPDGTTTADKIIETAETGNHFIVDSSSVSFSVGQIGTSAVFLKAGERSAAVMQITDPSSPSRTRLQAIVDLSAGTITTQEFNSPTDTKSSITDAGNGWYLVKLSMATKAAGPMECLFGPLDSTSYTTNLPSYTGDGSSGIYAWGAHIFRSDLGGMVDNPDRGDSYVPTTSSAKYLPRIGHHVYNGSAWVNEGLLAESEARTNLLPYSNDFTNSEYVKTNTATLALDAVGPDGQEDSACTLVDSNAGGTGAVILREYVTVAASTAHTFSLYVKKSGLSKVMLYHANFTSPTDNGWVFDLEDGTFSAYGGTPNSTATIQEVGNGWYRCAITFTTGSTDTAGELRVYPYGSSVTVDLDGTSSVLIYGAQLEQASTPSSLIPTDAGSSVTRAAETFTIPSANLPWPSPNYIGSELVTNGTFDTDSDWTKGTGWTISGGKAVGSSAATLSQSASTISGNTYLFKFTVSNYSAGTITPNISGRSGPSFTGNGTFEVAIVAAGGAAFNLLGGGNFTGDIDNVSVREINPLSVSIAMDGRMTYADINAYSTVIHQRWYESGNDLITFRIDTFGIQEGHLISQQNESGVADYATAFPSNTAYAPDILVPFDIASRYGSTFIQIMGEARGGTTNTTPTALPDLSSTDLELAYKFMGTIGTFRVWDKDLGDTGIVEATNPSLEPSLSLTFEGTGTNSFVVNDWSE